MVKMTDDGLGSGAILTLRWLAGGPKPEHRSWAGLAERGLIDADTETITPAGREWLRLWLGDFAAAIGLKSLDVPAVPHYSPPQTPEIGWVVRWTSEYVENGALKRTVNVADVVHWSSLVAVTRGSGRPRSGIPDEATFTREFLPHPHEVLP